MKIKAQILKALYESKDWLIVHDKDKSGMNFTVENINLIPDQDPRTKAEWREAFLELYHKDYLERIDDICYRLTNAGRKIAEKL